MKRKRHTEEQIIAILKEHEAGMKTADLCRKHGITEASFYNWKAKYSGLEVSEAKRLRGLESENARLKKLLADAMLDNAALKDLLAKNGDACQRAAESPHFGACNFPHLAGWRSAVFLISASVFRRSTTTLDRGGRG